MAAITKLSTIAVPGMRYRLLRSKYRIPLYNFLASLTTFNFNVEPMAFNFNATARTFDSTGDLIRFNFNAEPMAFNFNAKVGL